MKKLLLFLSLCCAGAAFGQTPVTDAKDFTVKDTDGKSYTLFTLLGQNKYVLIDCWASW
jgi:hypothetical protein